jgi:hypothetical protein
VKISELDLQIGDVVEIWAASNNPSKMTFSQQSCQAMVRRIWHIKDDGRPLVLYLFDGKQEFTVSSNARGWKIRKLPENEALVYKVMLS